MSNYVAITGKITLTTYSEITNCLTMGMQLNGTLVGNTVDINSFIDTGLLGVSQNFVIPKASFGLTNQTVDEFNLVVERTGGAKPVFDMDDIQLEKAGGSVVYTATTPKGTFFHVDEVVFAIADTLDTTLASGTTLNLDHDKLMDLSALANGIVFQRIQDGRVNFAVLLKDMAEFLSNGGAITNQVSIGSKLFLSISIPFPVPIILDGSKGDKLTFTISDDLSGLDKFRAISRGSIEI